MKVYEFLLNPRLEKGSVSTLTKSRGGDSNKY